MRLSLLINDVSFGRLHMLSVRYYKMRDAIFTIFLQHFHNKSQMVSCYWFKFELNTKIIFLPKQ